VCHYCGCRQIPLIRDYIDEHERVTHLGAEALRAVGHGKTAEATRMIAEMAALLRSHWRGEEDGVFKVMADADDLYAEYIAPLVREHRELEAFLASIDLDRPEDRERLRAEMVELGEHISREEDGLFPATLVTLAGPQWDAAIDAWHAAHPGEHLIED
jgi:hypothetical protein